MKTGELRIRSASLLLKTEDKIKWFRHVTALKLYNGTDHSNLDVLGYSQVFHESWDLHGFIYIIYVYIDSGLELEKKPRVNNETRDEKAMESCPLHCNQLHVFHNIAVVNQFLNIKV